MRPIRQFLGDPPLRYLLLGGASGVILYLAAQATPWRPFYSINNQEAMDFTQGLLGLLYVGLLLAPLLALRTPLVAAGLVAAPLVIGVFTEHEWPFAIYLGLLAVAVQVTWRHPRRGALIAAAAMLPILTMVFGWSAMVVPYGAIIDTGYQSAESNLLLFLAYAVVTTAVFGAGLWLRTDARRALDMASLREDRQAVQEQAAVVGERARLARDLHDVVAHHVSLIAVRAETAPYTHPDLPDDARGVLVDIAADARLALDELRGVLGILGRAEEGDRAPQPTWQDIGALVERSRGAGADIALEGAGDDEVGAVAGYAAYRVVQEALTNARKHAPSATVRVELITTDRLAEVRVVNQRTAVPRASTGGSGLIGMRERVEALGGRLRAGVVGPDFVVEAVLPRGAQ